MNTDRLEVLTAIENECKRKLLAVATPSIVLDHAASLERRAEDIFDEAQRIRSNLEEWTRGQGEIMEQLLAARVERIVLRTPWAEGSIGCDIVNDVKEEVELGRTEEDIAKRVILKLIRKVG